MLNIPEFQKYYQCDCQRYEWKSISHHVYNIRIIPTWFNWNIGLIHCTIAIVGFLGPCSIRQAFSWSIFYFIWLSHHTSRRKYMKRKQCEIKFDLLDNHHSFAMKRSLLFCWETLKKLMLQEDVCFRFSFNYFHSKHLNIRLQNQKSFFFVLRITIFIMFWDIKCIWVKSYE